MDSTTINSTAIVSTTIDSTTQMIIFIVNFPCSFKTKNSDVLPQDGHCHVPGIPDLPAFAGPLPVHSVAAEVVKPQHQYQQIVIDDKPFDDDTGLRVLGSKAGMAPR